MSTAVRARRRRDTPVAALMLVPSLVILGLFVLWPLARAAWLGHLRCDAVGRRCRDAGWVQYVDVFRSDEFQRALVNTFQLALLTVPAGLALGIGLAVLADKHLRGIGVFRTIFSSTVATSVAVASLMWLVLLQPQVGVLADALGGWFPVLKSPGLLNDPGTALGAVALSSIWANLGFTFIVMTAALQSIPKELYESAYVDGASSWMRFSNVTLPMLSPTILFATVVLTSRAFQAYGEIDLLTNGGPNPSRPTETIAYLVYGEGTVANADLGLKSAAAVLLFLVLLVLSFLQFRGLEKRVHYGG